MEGKTSVEVFERDERMFYLTVEPRCAIEGLRSYLRTQSEEVSVVEARAVGDIGVQLLNGKSIEDVLNGAACITKSHPANSPRLNDPAI